MTGHGPGRAAGYEAAVRSWAAHLVGGGTTDWRTWLDRHPEPPASPAPAVEVLPGAAQLELVRRLATSGPAVERFDELARRVLTTSAPGRGPGELSLVWPGAGAREDSGPGGAAGGFPAVDPSALDAEELLRACVGALAGLLHDVSGRGVDLPGPPRPGRVWVPWRRAFTVHGSPVLAEAVRVSLRRRGLLQGGRRAVHLVIAAPFDQMMAEHWIRRTRTGSDIAWARLWRRARTVDRVPPAIAVDELAGRLAAQSGPERVRLLVAADTTEAVVLAAEAMGLPGQGQRPGGGQLDPPYAPPLDVVSAELLRRLNGVLRLRVDAERRRQLAVDVLPRVVGHTGAGHLGAPRGLARWGRETGGRMAAALAGAGYPVLGDARLVVPGPMAGVRRTVDRDAVLELGLAACVRAWALLERPAPKER